MYSLTADDFTLNLATLIFLFITKIKTLAASGPYLKNKQFYVYIRKFERRH